MYLARWRQPLLWKQDGDSPLLLTARRGAAECARALAACPRISLDHQNADADSALHLAAALDCGGGAERQAEILQVLLSAGASPDLRNKARGSSTSAQKNAQSSACDVRLFLSVREQPDPLGARCLLVAASNAYRSARRLSTGQRSGAACTPSAPCSKRAPASISARRRAAPTAPSESIAPLANIARFQ